MSHKCRSCLGSLDSIIPLGMMPLANALTESPETNCKRYNLEVMLCADCGLAQLKDLVDPAELFTNYVYFSSNSETMLNSVKELVEKIIPKLNKDALVVEIASNDGYLLKNYVSKQINVIGIDPAQNIAQYANEQGIPTLCEFFNYELATRLKNEGKLADIVHANNVMAHVPYINDFIRGLKTILKPNGQIIIEVPYFLDLVQKLEFDTIYHEHVYYFALKPLIQAFSRNGMQIFNVEKLQIHGGTLRLFVGHDGMYPIDQIITSMLEMEKQAGLYDIVTYNQFMARLSKLRTQLVAKLEELKNAGKRVVAYGASAKGTTLLNYFSIGTYIDLVIDKSLAKQGMYTPGTGLKIVSAESLNIDNVSHALLLAWNFAAEIIAQQNNFTTSGGKFIIPLPEVEEVS